MLLVNFWLKNIQQVWINSDYNLIILMCGYMFLLRCH